MSSSRRCNSGPASVCKMDGVSTLMASSAWSSSGPARDDSTSMAPSSWHNAFHLLFPFLGFQTSSEFDPLEVKPTSSRRKFPGQPASNSNPDDVWKPRKGKSKRNRCREQSCRTSRALLKALRCWNVKFIAGAATLSRGGGRACVALRAQREANARWSQLHREDKGTYIEIQQSHSRSAS